MPYRVVARPRSRRAARPRPLAEAIEPRLLLSTYTVTNLNDAGPGSLRDAVQQANANAGPDTINFAAGLSGTITLTSGELAISDTSGTTTVVGQGLNVSSSNTLTLPQITIGAGASASFSNADLTGLQNHGTTSVKQCNAAAQLYNDGGTLDIASSILTNAGARQGGGSVYNNGGTVTIEQDMFFQDDPYAADSQILSNGGSMVLRDSTVYASGSGAAQGIVATGGTLLMVQDSLWTHTQDISIGSADAKLVNCTLLSIGIDPAATGANVTLYNTIVSGSVTGMLDQHPSPGQVPSSYNIVGTSTAGGLVNGLNGNLVGINPQLNFSPGDFGGPVYSLLPKAGSPAIDTGSNILAQDPAVQPAAALSTDQRGLPRVYNGRVDIGATEHQPVVVNSAADEVSTEVVPPGTVTLRQAVAVASDSADLLSVHFDPALFSAATPQTIWLLSYIPFNGPSTGSFDIDGPGPDSLTLVAPNGTFSTVVGNSRISGMGITGGGINRDCVASNSSNVVALSDIKFFDNHTDAIGNYGTGTIAVSNCIFSNNTVPGVEPGGIINNGTMTVTGCTFSGNSSTGAPGAIQNEGRLTVTSSTFANNSTTRINSGAAPGGAIHSATATNGLASVSAILIGDTFVNNSAGRGGAIGNGAIGVGTDTHSSMVVTNCTFAGNSAQSGAALTNGGSLTITNSTITGNTNSGFAAAVENVGSATINNTIVAANSKPDGTPADIYGVGTHAVIGSNNLIGIGGSGGLVNGVNGNIVGVADPKLGPLGNYGGPTETIPLLPGSPALDAGNNALAVDGSGNPLTTDQRGLPRIFNGTVDIGAYEAQPPTVAGDVNHDGTTNFSDLLLLAQHYGSAAQPMWEGGDLTGDGSVAFADLLMLAQNYGGTAPAASAGSVADLLKASARIGSRRRAI